MSEESFKNKYLKYKNKYVHLKKQLGGIGEESPTNIITLLLDTEADNLEAQARKRREESKMIRDNAIAELQLKSALAASHQQAQQSVLQIRGQTPNQESYNVEQGPPGNMGVPSTTMNSNGDQDSKLTNGKSESDESED